MYRWLWWKCSDRIRSSSIWMTRPLFTVYTWSVSTCSVRMFIHSGFTTTVGVYLIRVNDPLGTARHAGGYVTAFTVAAGSGVWISTKRFGIQNKLLCLCKISAWTFAAKNQSQHLFRIYCRFKNSCFNNTATKNWICIFLFINWHLSLQIKLVGKKKRKKQTIHFFPDLGWVDKFLLCLFFFLLRPWSWVFDATRHNDDGNWSVSFNLTTMNRCHCSSVKLKRFADMHKRSFWVNSKLFCLLHNIPAHTSCLTLWPLFFPEVCALSHASCLISILLSRRLEWLGKMMLYEDG